MVRFRNALDHESDRGCALAAAAYLDHKLQIDALIVMSKRPKQPGDLNVDDAKQSFEPSKKILESVMSPAPLLLVVIREWTIGALKPPEGE